MGKLEDKAVVRRKLEDKAVVRQVRHCGCSHCRHLVYHALGTPEAIEKFWNKPDELEKVV